MEVFGGREGRQSVRKASGERKEVFGKEGLGYALFKKAASWHISPEIALASIRYQRGGVCGEGEQKRSSKGGLGKPVKVREKGRGGP